MIEFVGFFSFAALAANARGIRQIRNEEQTPARCLERGLPQESTTSREYRT